MQHVREREITFAVDQEWALPDLARLVPAGGRLDTATHELSATYVDADGDRLRLLGVTLRQRSGGDDAGWHLKVPAGDARMEHRTRSHSPTPPKSLTDQLIGVLGGLPLHEVATVRTTRTVHRLLNATGELVAEVADDAVEGRRMPSPGDSLAAPAADPDRWREIEVELGAVGDEETLRTITGLLRANGAVPSPTQRKLDRLLGAPELARPSSSLGRLVADYVREQATAILLGDIALRVSIDDEQVHASRVAVRRLRSTLRMFGDLIDADANSLDEELQWFAGLLGPIRDSDVMGARLVEEIHALAREDVLGPVVQQVQTELAAERSAAVRALRAARNRERYLTVLALLADWVASPPVAEPSITDQAERRPARVLKKASRTVQRRLASVGADPEDLHRARKAAKRLRYTADLLVPAVAKAKKAADRAKQLQTTLGEYQDLAVASEFLRRQGARVGVENGHNGFTYGVLVARLDQRAAAIRAEMAH